MDTVIARFVDVFQSLIGRLQTGNVIQDIDILKEFQSLIGRLQTRERERVDEDKNWFQSLIGRLQTPRFRYDVDQGNAVSIPHR